MFIFAILVLCCISMNGALMCDRYEEKAMIPEIRSRSMCLQPSLESLENKLNG